MWGRAVRAASDDNDVGFKRIDRRFAASEKAAMRVAPTAKWVSDGVEWNKRYSFTEPAFTARGIFCV
jgi:hypothetical protein